MRFAFSTLAFPSWTLDRVASFAKGAGFAGVELRTFGHADPSLACDPCHTDGAKIREMFEDHGIDVSGIATSIRYDQPVFPPIIGRAIGDFDKPVRETKAMVEVARAAGGEYVRVYGFELGTGEEHASGSRRVIERARSAAVTTRHTGVSLVLESGGSYPQAYDIGGLVEQCRDARVKVGYKLSAAAAAGDGIASGAVALGEALRIVRVTDTRAGKPTRLGQGDLELRETVEALAEVGYDGWVVIDWPVVWMPTLESPEGVLADAASKLYEWAGTAAGPKRRHDPGVRVGARL